MALYFVLHNNIYTGKKVDYRTCWRCYNILIVSKMIK